MRGILPVFTILCFSALMVAFPPSVNAEGKLRVFTDKKGQKIEASLLAVAPDWKKMKIRRKDGVEFETEIVNLRLDDQQFIKEWINQNPIEANFRLDISLDTKLVDSDRQKTGLGAYTLDTKVLETRITVKNLSREVLSAPLISYIIVKKERVEFLEDEDDGLTYSLSSEIASELPLTIRGEEEGADIAFNVETTIQTKQVEINRLVIGSNELEKEDEILGIIVQVKDRRENLIEEFYSKGSVIEIKDMSWEDAMKLPRDESEEDDDDPRPPRPGRTMVNGPSTHNLQKGDMVDGPLDVEKMPISIKARVGPDSSSKDGMLVSVGARKQGLAIYIEDDKLIGTQVSNSESTKVMIRPPLGDFDVELRLTEKTLKLFVNGREENSETSLGLFTRPLKAGIEVGQDTPPTLIEGDGPFSFSGKIENVIVQIGP